jgi:broad specificity phosphatase PhoE
MKLLFIRHGQTDYNKNKLPQGQEIDASLNGTGINQAREAAKSLPRNIDIIISSPLKRAFQTAEILNEILNKKIEFSDDIKEFSYGELAGKPWPEIVKTTGDKDIKEKDDNVTFDYSGYGGESANDLKIRVAKFVEEVKRKYFNKTVLVVSHSGVMDAMHILYPQKEKAETSNASLHEFQFE